MLSTFHRTWLKELQDRQQTMCADNEVLDFGVFPQKGKLQSVRARAHLGANDYLVDLPDPRKAPRASLRPLSS